jgi:tight adherence protein B
MFERVVVLGVLALALAMVVRLWSIARARRIARERLLVGQDEPEIEKSGPDQPEQARPFLTRWRWLPFLSGAIMAALVYFGVGLKLSYALMFAAITGLLAHEVEVYLAARKTLLIEQQLADSIDLMVASLRAGAGLMNCLEAAIREARNPLRPQLEEVLARIRYGDDPVSVYEGLMARVPLETFRLFCAAMMVHQEVGGSLAPTLATVGRIIRDRIELTRRVRSLSVQSRASTVAILFTTYFIGVVLWRTDPDRMEEFLGNTIGGALVSGAVVLQAVGIVWSSWLSRLNF